MKAPSGPLRSLRGADAPSRRPRGGRLAGVVLALAARARRAPARRARLAGPRREDVGLRSRGPQAIGVAAPSSSSSALGLGAALARPRWGETTETVERRGADVVLVLDTSASMRATDVTPSRFVLARQAAALAPVESSRATASPSSACEGEAQTLVPLTLDTAAVGIFLDALEPGIGDEARHVARGGARRGRRALPRRAPAGRKRASSSPTARTSKGASTRRSRGRRARESSSTPSSSARRAAKGLPSPRSTSRGSPAATRRTRPARPSSRGPTRTSSGRLAAETGGTFSVVSPGRTDLSGVARRDRPGRAAARSRRSS